MSDIKHLTTGQVAKYCGVHYQTVIRWIKSGKLKAFQLPGRGDRRVRANDFVSFLNENNFPIPEEFDSPTRAVLIVDDVKSEVEAIKRVLRKTGAKLHVAMDGFEAGRMLETISPDLMTLDLMMPGVDGFQVLKRIRSSDQFKRLKILAISALPEEELQKALTEGADDVLAKPFENQLLLDKVNALLGMK